MKRNRGKMIVATVGIFLLLIAIQTLPVLIVAPLGSQQISGETVRVHHQADDAEGAREVFELLEEKCGSLRATMKAAGTGLTDVYIYHTQWQLAIREAGFVTLAFAPKWYIGDSHNGNVMLVSPNTTVPGHTHETILQAALHEYVHALVHQVNPGLSYFWDNGLATYLAGQKPDEAEFRQMQAPTLADMHTENGLYFGNIGGYAFSYKYIEYLDKTYGWEKVLAFASGKGSYEDIFAKSEQALYDDWCKSINKSRS